MKLEEAIRLLTVYSDNMEIDGELRLFKDAERGWMVEAIEQPGLIEPEYEAIKLGIEALKYIHMCQTNENTFNISPLPGQTE